VADPEGGGLVPQEVAPAAGAGGPAARVLAVGDGAGAGDHHHADAVAGAGHQGDGGVVHHPHVAAEAEAGDHLPYDRHLRRPVGAGDPQADGAQGHRRVEGQDHLVEGLFDPQLARDPEVGAARAGLAHDLAVLVRQQADGLGASGVEPDDVAHALRLFHAVRRRRKTRAGSGPPGDHQETER
jgi:hypothetical protein